MDITIRTALAFLILGTASSTEWKTVTQAGTKPLLYMIVGSGTAAGAAGMLCFYAALKRAPLFGALMGVLFNGDALTPQTVIGTGLTAGGIIVLTLA